MSERQIWFVTPPKFPWNFVEPVHRMGWWTLGLWIGAMVALWAGCVALVFRTLNPIWLIAAIFGQLVVMVCFFLTVHARIGPRSEWEARKASDA